MGLACCDLEDLGVATISSRTISTLYLRNHGIHMYSACPRLLYQNRVLGSGLRIQGVGCRDVGT